MMEESILLQNAKSELERAEREEHAHVVQARSAQKQVQVARDKVQRLEFAQIEHELYARDKQTHS